MNGSFPGDGQDEPKAVQGPRKAAQQVASRQPAFSLPPVVLAFLGACAVLHGSRVNLLTQAQDLWLLIHAAFIPILYSRELFFEYYPVAAPVTYSFLHGSVAHLAINLVWLAAFGSPLANRIGAVRFVLFWAAASAAAACLHYLVHIGDETPLVGASGAISGMMGAAARFAFRIERPSGRAAFRGPVLPIGTVLRSRSVVVFLLVWLAVNLFTGLAGFAPGMESQIAWEAHVGGFLLGFFGIRAFDKRVAEPSGDDPACP